MRMRIVRNRQAKGIAALGPHSITRDARRTVPGGPWIGVLALMVVCALAATGLAQRRFAVQVEAFRADVPVRVLRSAVKADVAADSAEGDDDSEQKFPGGAPLKTDPELERLLKRAEEFALDERYDLAVILWQKVLDDTGDTLVTRDGRMYTSLSEEVEGTIAKLPPDGLRVYRVSADGEAKAVLAQGKGDGEEEALAEVVRRYFLSSVGDDAAYRLGCMALDRHDFVGASRLFSKILEEHPDPNITQGQVLLRLAVAAAHVGDRPTALQFVALAEKAPGIRVPDEAVEAVRKDIEQTAGDSVAAGSGTGQWLMSLGSPSRRGHMQSLPPEVTHSTLTELWTNEFLTSYSGTITTQQYGRVLVRRGGNVPVNVSASPEQLINRWRENGWMPAGQLLVADGRVYCKTADDLVCWDTREVAEKAAEDVRPAWRTAWVNSFQLDPTTEMYINMGIAANLGNRPMSLPELMYFGDRVHQSMSIWQGVVYNIEGARSSRGSQAGGQQVAQQRQFNYGVVPRRSRRNWLAAYDARTGKVKWYKGASDNEALGDAEIGFLAAPVPYGNLLLLPVTDSGTIWMQARSQDTGDLVWKTYLCDEPAGGCSPWSPVGVAVEGRDAYVLCGAGVVFALDAVSGSIRYAVRYERSGKDNPLMKQYGYGAGGMLDLSGWDEDVVIPYGRALVVMASDNDRLFALDRRTGELLWDSPRTPFEHSAGYCLGVVGRGLFVGGGNVVRRYDIVSGRLLWEREFEQSYGRGALTEDAVYLPVRDSVAKLDLETGKIAEQVGVSLTSGAPVGNLYSDGEKLWVLAGDRVHALTNLEHRMKLLEGRIADRQSSAYFERMLLLAKLERMDEAVSDLLSGYALVRENGEPHEALQALLSGMSEIHLATAQPATALNILADEFLDPRSAEALKDKNLTTKRNEVAIGALRTIRQQKPVGSVAAVLKYAPLLQEGYQVAAARRAVLDVASVADTVALRWALRGDSPSLQIVAAAALAKVAPETAAEPLAALLGSADESVKLEGARGLANLGSRAALPAFLELMASEEIPIRSAAGQALRNYTGQELPYDAYEADKAKRAEQLKPWRAWVAAEGAGAELIFPLPESKPLLGRTLIAYYNQSLVVELDAEGKERWRMQVPNPWACQGLPNGHRVFALYGQNKVIEYDDQGNEVWSKDGLPGQPFSIQRLESGNTLVACSNSNKVVEIDPEGNVDWEATVANRPMDARRLENGNTLVALSNDNKVVEVDPSGKVVHEISNMNGPVSASRLENGNTLVTQMNTGQVVEVDREGKIVWSATGLPQPYEAQRLPNGNTLVAAQNAVLEFDSKGKVVWQHDGNLASGVSRY